MGHSATVTVGFQQPGRPFARINARLARPPLFAPATKSRSPVLNSRTAFVKTVEEYFSRDAYKATGHECPEMAVKRLSQIDPQQSYKSRDFGSTKLSFNGEDATDVSPSAGAFDPAPLPLKGSGQPLAGAALSVECLLKTEAV